MRIYEPTPEEEFFNRAYNGCLLIVVVLVLLMVFLCGCTSTRYVPVVEHRTDTMLITKHQRDSIWLHDSIYMHEYQKGDTTFLFRDRWHTQYVEKQVHDTIYISKTDTVPQPYPVEVEVPDKLTWWQKFRLHIANILLYTLAFMCVWWIVRIYRKATGW